MNSDKNTEPRFFDTIKQDFREGDLLNKVKREYRDLKDFYIDSEKRERLSKMNRLRRFFFVLWWMLKGMFFKLTPIRRILLLIGTVLIILSRNVQVEDVNVTSNEGLIGGLIILFVLMLELKDKLLARDELQAGRQIQLALLPERSPIFPGWSIWLYTSPANDVGGDLVDFIQIDNEKSSVVIADVAGKGLKAALLTTKLQATIRALVSYYTHLPELISKISEVFYKQDLRNIFASLLYIELFSNSSLLKYVNAGHLPPLLIKNGSIQELPKGDAAIGLLDQNTFKENIIELQSSDIFIAYSDGITDAQNESGLFFGYDRFIQILKSSKDKTADGLGQLIVSEISRFIGNARVNDDVSIIILKRD